MALTFRLTKVRDGGKYIYQSKTVSCHSLTSRFDLAIFCEVRLYLIVCYFSRKLNGPVSYSHNDGLFVDAIESKLINAGIRFWRDIHHGTAGRLEKQIDQAIHLNDVVLLNLSKHSTNSDWVEHEVRKAREKEKQTGKDALCPVALDDSWKTCRWPGRLREQIMEYNILDFSNWQDTNYFQKMFGRLLEGLNLFYK